MKNQSQNGRYAVVIGGSMAGLLTAQVLSQHFDHVTVLDRDQLPQVAQHRQGVPQSRHIHVLLTRGAQIVEELFPGIMLELEAAGATVFDMSADMRAALRGRWLPRNETGITGLSCSRVLLETSVRRRLLANHNITIRSGAEVTNLLTDDSGKRVMGVQINWRRHADGDGPGAMGADLVVDASGRSSRTPQWLTKMGYEAPTETVVDPKLGYATRRYQGIPSPDWRMMFIFAHPEVNSRGGAIMKEEGDRWVVTLGGFAGDYPPTDEPEFMAFAHDIHPEFYAAFKDAEPISPIVGYRRTENRWRHYEQLPDWPAQFVVLGDATCGFNPIYGQGMTVAALSALALGELLSEVGADAADLAKTFQKRVTKVIAPVWLLATSEDYRWLTTEGGNPNVVTRLVHKYFDYLQILSAERPDVVYNFLAVQQLLKPSYALFQPTFVWEVLKLWLRPSQRARWHSKRI